MHSRHENPDHPCTKGREILALAVMISISASAQDINLVRRFTTSPASSTTTGRKLPLLRPDTVPARTHTGSIQVGALVSSTEQTPFWLQTNQFGIIPKTSPAGLAIASLQSDYLHKHTTKRRWLDWGYGFQLAGQATTNPRLLIAEGYGKVRLGPIELSVGRRRQIIGLAESPLSSGSYIWSGNALPIPRVELAIPDYLPLGFTRGWIAFKGNFAHGWFGNQTYVQRSFLHQKALYLRIGKPKARIRGYGAFTHQAQWAGYAPFLERDPTSSFEGRLANSFVAYMNVVVPLKTDALKNLAKFTTFDQNRVGDHRGSAEAALEFRLPHGSIFAYQQHFYDLGRKLYNLRNIEDGLYGIRYLNNRRTALLSELVVELFNSGNQGVLQFGRSLGGEHENYFINGQYPEGWSYEGRTLGTPLISQASDLNPALPAIPFSGYTLDNQLIQGVFSVNNNRVWALHTGVSGRPGRSWGYTGKVTFSKNYGTFTRPFPASTNQLSCLLSVTKTMRKLKGSTLIVSLAYDEGKLLKYPRQIGGYVGWQKTWSALSR